MSRYEWIENDALIQIAANVYDAKYANREDGDKPDHYILQIKNLDELQIIAYALIHLRRYVDGKRMPGQHTGRSKQALMDKLDDVGETLYAYGLVDEYRDLMEVKHKINRRKMGTAKQYALSISKNIEKELKEVATSQIRIKQIKRFITDAVLIITQDPTHYESDITSLSTLI